MPPTTKEQARRGVARATMLWGMISLSGIVLLAGFTIWHLVRRGRVLRDSLGNPRRAELPDVSPPSRDP